MLNNNNNKIIITDYCEYIINDIITRIRIYIYIIQLNLELI